MTEELRPSIATTPLPRGIHTLWRVMAVVQAAVVAVVAVLLGIVFDSAVVVTVALVFAVVFLVVRWWVIELDYARFRWGIDDRWVERRSGVITRTTQVVPRSRVQTLTTRAGPIDRRLGLSSVVIHTAGTHTPNLVIPHLELDVAERLKAELGA